MDIQRAKAVCEVAQVIINTAKLEVALIEAVGGDSRTEFFGPEKQIEAPQPQQIRKA